MADNGETEESASSTREERFARGQEVTERALSGGGSFSGSTGTSVSVGGRVVAVGRGSGRSAAIVEEGETAATSGGQPILIDDQVLTREKIEQERKAEQERQQAEEIKRQQIVAIAETERKLGRRTAVTRGERGEVILEGEGRRKVFIPGGGFVEAPSSATVRPEFVRRPTAQLREDPFLKGRQTTTERQPVQRFTETRPAFFSTEAVEQRIEDLGESERLFFSESGSVGGFFTATRKIASTVTLGGGVPVEERGKVFGIPLAGGTEEAVRGFLNIPVALPGTAFFIGQKAIAAGEATVFLGAGREVLTELGVSEFIPRPVRQFLPFEKDTAIRRTAKQLTTGETAVATIETALIGGFFAAATDAGAGFLPKVKIERTTVDVAGRATPVEITTVGIERAGKPIASVTRRPPEIFGRQGKDVKVIREPGGQFKRVGKKVPDRVTDFGKPKSSFIETAKIQKDVAVPRSATGTEALIKVFKTSEAEKARVEAFTEVVRQARLEKGLPVQDPIFKLETLKDQKRASKEIIKIVAEEEGVIFGSALGQQLPPKFRAIPGDIDIFFPGKTEAQITGEIIPRTVKRLKELGEDVQVSETNPAIIEQPGTRAKIIEAKAGKGEITEISGSEVASAGGFGFDLPNIKAGQIGDTVAFGEARGIRAGEQLQRKTQASAFLRGADKGADTPPAFQEAGIFPKGRRTKDIADFTLQGLGVAEIQGGLRGAKTEAAVIKAFETFTPEQQATIIDLALERTGGKTKLFDFSQQPEAKPPAVSPLKPQVGEQLTGEPDILIKSPKPVEAPPSPRISPSPKVTIGAGSPVLSPSPRFSPGIPSPSPRPSPSPSISPSISPSPSPSPSPGKSGSPSPRPSPSPSVVLSPTPSPSPAPSPPPSPILSPSPSPAPSPPPSPILTGEPPPSITGFKARLPRDRDTEPSFLVEIRRRGVFQEVGTEPTPEKAFSRASFLVGTTAAASLRVTAVGADTDTIAFGRRFLPTRQFRPSKKDAGVFVERREQRIKSPGELGEITFKGIATQKARRRSRAFNIFGG